MATSLLVLASEEAIKAMMLLRYYQLNKTDENIGEIFGKHDMKLTLIAEYMFFAYFLGEMGKIFEKLQSGDFSSEAELNKAMKALLKDFGIWCEEEIDNSNSDLWKKVKWWRKANVIKLSGLYVDWNNKWVSPKQVSRKSYQNALTFAQEFIDIANKLSNPIYHSDSMRSFLQTLDKIEAKRANRIKAMLDKSKKELS